MTEVPTTYVLHKGKLITKYTRRKRVGALFNDAGEFVRLCPYEEYSALMQSDPHSLNGLHWRVIRIIELP